MSAVIHVNRLRKTYTALRPLRVESLTVESGQRVAVSGIDGPGAEILVDLLTGAMLPEQGTIRLFGRDTATITTPDEWFATLDRVGLVSMRARLVGELTVAQNLALAFTLSVDPIAEKVRADILRLSVEAGIPLDQLDRPAGETTRDVSARCHLARALATDPAVLVLEHANALTTPADAPAFGRDVARVAKGRRLAVLAVTADPAFADAVANRVFELDAATGRLASRSGWRRWFG